MTSDGKADFCHQKLVGLPSQDCFDPVVMRTTPFGGILVEYHRSLCQNGADSKIVLARRDLSKLPQFIKKQIARLIQ